MTQYGSYDSLWLIWHSMTHMTQYGSYDSLWLKWLGMTHTTVWLIRLSVTHMAHLSLIGHSFFEALLPLVIIRTFPSSLFLASPYVEFVENHEYDLGLLIWTSWPFCIFSCQQASPLAALACLGFLEFSWRLRQASAAIWLKLNGLAYWREEIQNRQL